MINFLEELSKYGLTEKSYEQCLYDITEKVNGNNDMDWQEIVDKYQLPISKDCLRKASSANVFGNVFVSEYYKMKNSNSNVATIDKAIASYKSESSINKDGTYTSDKLLAITADELKNPESLLKAHGFDISEWELVSARNNIWNVYSKQDGVQELYSSKIVVKPRTEISVEEMSKWFDKLDRNYSLPPIRFKKENNGNKCLLIDIADLHLNLYASMFVTGNEYNCQIAEQLFFHVINDVLSRTNHYEFDKIIFVIGGDMLNSDNLAGTTTKGTPQSNEKHLFEAYEKICEMTIKAIDILSEYAPVEVVYVPGNHDMSTGFKLAKYVDAWYRKDEDVYVDYSPLPRKYVKYGNTLMVFAHDGNVKTLPRLIADEARNLWSEIETTEVFLQHLHSEQVLLEENNMRIQRLPTISALSEWAVNKGFGSKRQCKSFIFDKNDGLYDVIYTPIRNL